MATTPKKRTAHKSTVKKVSIAKRAVKDASELVSSVERSLKAKKPDAKAIKAKVKKVKARVTKAKKNLAGAKPKKTVKNAKSKLDKVMENGYTGSYYTSGNYSQWYHGYYDGNKKRLAAKVKKLAGANGGWKVTPIVNGVLAKEPILSGKKGVLYFEGKATKTAKAKAKKSASGVKSKARVLKPRGVILSKVAAQKISSEWHGGQRSALYSFASSGIFVDKLYSEYIAEIDECLKGLTKGTSKLKSLKKFFAYKHWEASLKGLSGFKRKTKAQKPASGVKRAVKSKRK